MKRKWISFMFLLLLLLPLPYKASAAGSFVASRNSDVFHKSSCFYVDRINSSNKIYFGSVIEALQSGRRGCYRCNPVSTSTTQSSTASSGSTQMKNNVNEAKSYSSGLSDGKKIGYKEGYAAAETEAKETLKKAKRDAVVSTLSIVLFVGFPIVSVISGAKESRKVTAFRKEKADLIKKHNEEKAELIQSHNQELLDKTKTFESEMSSLKRAHELETNSTVMRYLSKDSTDLLMPPPGVKLNVICVPVKGRVSKTHPYGDYTVYATASGRKYHCKYNCSGATKPMHLFEIPEKLEPCGNCVPMDMRARSLPQWYVQIRQKEV